MINTRFDSFICAAVPISSRDITEIARKVTSGLRIDILSLDILITHDLAMQNLNQRFLNMEGPTNVLSFPGQDGDKPATLGQLVINADAIKRESFLYDQDPYTHLARLMIHGILHLAGFEHGRIMDDTAQELMREITNE